MNTNLKVDMTFDAPDLELEILSQAQQQTIMGGSNSSNGDFPDDGPTSSDDISIDHVKAFVNGMFEGGSFGTFFPNTNVNVDKFKNSLVFVGRSTMGMQMLQKLKTSGIHVTLVTGNLVAGSADYGYGSNILQIGGIGGKDAELVSHELMHIYQDVKGRNGSTVGNEVDGYIFKAMVQDIRNINTGPIGAGELNSSNVFQLSTDGQAYQNAMNNLVDNGFTLERYNTVLSKFKTGAAVGAAYASATQTLAVTQGSTADDIIREFLAD